MEIIAVMLALALPVLLGALWLGLLIPPQHAHHWALILGNGTMTGLLSIPLLMRLADGLGMAPVFQTTAPIAGLLIVVAVFARKLKAAQAPPTAPPAGRFSTEPRAHQVLMVLLGALLALRLGTLGLELLWRPLFPWDATMHWATKARVWFEYGAIVPFVDNELWLELAGEGVFTDHHPNYPITIPLLQLWMNSATGHWDESLMNLPWLLCLASLGAAFYGQSRAAGASPTLSMTFTYLLLSMPLINTHVALAGYADLFLGACYGMALMAFHNWSVTRQSWQAMLALFFAIGCALIKNEGLYWLLTFVPALVVVIFPRRKAAMLLASMLVALACILIFMPKDLAFAGHSLARLRLDFRPAALPALATGVLVQGSWHLFGYLLAGLLPLGLLATRMRTADSASSDTYLGIIVALAGALGLFGVLFLFTGYASGAIGFTAAGRISIHLVPGLTFLAMLLCNEVFRVQQLRSLQVP